MLSKNRPTFGDRFTVRQTLDWVFDEWKQTVAEGNPNHYNKVWAAIEACANSVADIRGYGESDPSVTPDQPAAPDEDAAVRLTRDRRDWLAKVIRGQVYDCDEHGIYKAGSLQRCYRALDSLEEAGYRRPVDTRPTRSQVWNVMTNGIDSISAHTARKLCNALQDAKLITPDPAPDAEVPVVEVRRDDLDWAVAELAKQRRAAFVEPDYNEWFAMHSRLKRAAHGPALTKATDR